MIDQILKQNPDQSQSISIRELCWAVNISPATYYRVEKENGKKKQKENSHSQSDNREVRQRLQQLAEKHPRYGYRRMHQQLKREGFCCGKHTVQRLMREEGLKCRPQRPKPTTTKRDRSHPQKKDRRPTGGPSRINELWVGDITYIPLEHSFVYLCTVMDAFSRKVVGWKLSRHIDAQLTKDAMQAALDNRNLTEYPPLELIFHSDHGSQYTAREYQELLSQHGIESSMGNVGDSYDNAMAESLFKTIKAEEVYQTAYDSWNVCYRGLASYLDDYYNHERLHSALGYLPPIEFEDSLFVEQGVA